MILKIYSATFPIKHLPHLVVVDHLSINLIYFHVNSLILCVPTFTVFNLFIEKIMPWDP